MDHPAADESALAWEQLASSYDVVAGAYDAQFVDELDGKPRDRALLEAFAASVVDPVIDLGCGPGQIGLVLREHGREVVGVDLSRGMARLAAGRLGTAIVADLRDLPIADGALGAVVAFYSLIHVPRPQLGAALQEVHRVLRPGGEVLLSAHEGEGRIELDRFLDEPVPFVATLFTLDELTEACAAAGLDVTLAERRAPYPAEHPTTRLSVGARRPDLDT